MSSLEQITQYFLASNLWRWSYGEGDRERNEERERERVRRQTFLDLEIGLECNKERDKIIVKDP